MICQACRDDGKTSIVHEGSSFTTAMGLQRYYDEAGKLHVHDPNVTSTHYSCSRGHVWEVRKKPDCPTCGEMP